MSSSWQRVSRPSRAEVYRRVIEKEVSTVDEAAMLLAMVLDYSQRRFSADAIAQLHSDLARLLNLHAAPKAHVEPEPADSELEAVTSPLHDQPSQHSTTTQAPPPPTATATSAISQLDAAPSVTVATSHDSHPLAVVPEVPVSAMAVSSDGTEAVGAGGARDLSPTNGAEDWNIKAITSKRPHLRPVLESEEAIAALVSRMRNPMSGVEITDRRFRLKTYPACFVGSEAVDWLFKSIPAVTSRDDAVIIGQYLLNKGIFCHVLQEHSFCDGYYFYRFTRRKRVVVVGGGFAGSIVAKNLQRFFNVVLIDSKHHFECIPSLPFIVGNARRATGLQVLHSAYLRETQILTAKVQTISPQCVTLEDGSSLSFDYLVVATGSSYTRAFQGPTVYDACNSESLLACNVALATAKNAVIVGGGPTGVEIAGQVAFSFPSCQVTLITSAAKFLERSAPSAGQVVIDTLGKLKNVELIVSERVISHSDHQVTLSSGRTIDCEVLFPCCGFVPRTEVFRATMAHVLDERGFVKVNESLQVEGYPHIFAAGDIVAIAEEKLAQNAQQHGEVICNNIKRLEVKRKLVEYSPSPRPMLVSLGPDKAMMIAGSLVLTEGMIASKLKDLVEFKIVRGL